MRALVTLLGFMLAMVLFRTATDMAWFPAVFFSAIAGLIIGTALTKSGHEAIRRISVNMRKGWSS